MPRRVGTVLRVHWVLTLHRVFWGELAHGARALKALLDRQRRLGAWEVDRVFLGHWSRRDHLVCEVRERMVPWDRPRRLVVWVGRVARGWILWGEAVFRLPCQWGEAVFQQPFGLVPGLALELALRL